MGKQNEYKENHFKAARRVYNENQEYKSEEITQSDLAKIIHRDKGNISKLEAGKLKTITLEQVMLYHEKFGVSMEYLVYDTINAMFPENIRVSSDLGVTDSVADTMVMLKNMSSDENDYTAVLNAFLGNKEATFNFINSILTYLYCDFSDNKKNSSVYDALITTTVINYINQYIKPQLQPMLEAKHKIIENQADITPTTEDFDIIQQMVESCYNDNLHIQHHHRDL